VKPVNNPEILYNWFHINVLENCFIYRSRQLIIRVELIANKLTLLVAVGIAAFLGMSVVALLDLPDVFRYTITILGEFLIILVSIVIGIDNVRHFTTKSVFGRSLVFILAGIALWGIGNLFWLHYNLSGIEVPYPSLADIGYIGMIPLAAVGLFLLLKGIKMKMDSATIVKLAILPVIVFVLTYFVFIESKLTENISLLTKALNVAYPVGDAIFLSFALMILSIVRGGKIFRSIGIICVGFVIESFADLSFSWTTSAGTYAVGGWVDGLFTLAFLVIGIGIYYMKDVRR
jgi:hypothetical protein